MNKNEIPATDSIEELAKFWDTHDISDFDDELEEVAEPIFAREHPENTDSADLVKIELPSQELELLNKLAKAEGVDHNVLVRRWVLEKLRAA